MGGTVDKPFSQCIGLHRWVRRPHRGTAASALEGLSTARDPSIDDQHKPQRKGSILDADRGSVLDAD